MEQASGDTNERAVYRLARLSAKRIPITLTIIWSFLLHILFLELKLTELKRWPDDGNRFPFMQRG